MIKETFSPVMAIDWDGVTHITKVDPAEALPSDLDILVGTDLVIIGGSDGVTEANSLRTIEQIQDVNPRLPLVQEPSSPDQISTETVQAVDTIVVPSVYNSGRENFAEKHIEFFTKIAEEPELVLEDGASLLGDIIDLESADMIDMISDKILCEGYVIQNPASKAATESGVEMAYSPEQITGAAMATESLYGFPIFYIEYSGRYGGPEDVSAAAKCLSDTFLFYGGGIKTQQQTEDILDAGADAVVVGDCFHDDPEQYLKTIPSSSSTH